MTTPFAFPSRRAPASRTALAVLSLASATAACRDTTGAPAASPPPPMSVATAFRCTATVATTPRISCVGGLPATARTTSDAVTAAMRQAPTAAPTAADASLPTRDILIGGRRYLQLFFNAFRFETGTRTLSLIPTFENRVGQPMGTTDGVNPDGVEGIRLVLVSDPVVVGVGSGTVTQDARWNETVTTQQGTRPAVRCAGESLSGVVQPNEFGTCSEAGFVLGATVQQFEFTVVVSARLPDESPLGFANEPNVALDVAALATGGCAAKPFGFVACWGGNEYGQRGRVDFAYAYGAAATPGRRGRTYGGNAFGGLAAGATHACAIRSDGVAECWGSGVYGESGAGVNVPSSPLTSIVDVGATTFESLTAGRQFSCGVTTTQQVRCWGRNDVLQLGSSGGATSASRAIGASLVAARVVAGRAHACALEDVTGAVWCWGDNSRGQLGRGTFGGPQLPAPVVGLGGAATGIAVGDDHSCASLDTGDVWCWGANESGQLGIGTADADAASPVAVFEPGLEEVYAGGRTTCATRSVGDETFCWGDNREGQLGFGSAVSYAPIPGAVTALDGAAVLRLAVGDSHVCAVLGTGGDNVRCWGSDFTRALGADDVAVRGRRASTPVTAVGTGNLDAIAAGDGFTCGTTAEAAAELVCWGANGVGQAAVAPITAPAQAAGIIGRARLQRVWGGTMHACGLDVDGRAWCWGNNAYGQLGRGTAGDLGAGGQAAPDTVNGPGLRFAELALGRAHTCGRTRATDEIWCWGDNGRNQVSGLPSGLFAEPTRVDGVPTPVQVVAGEYHTCAVDATNGPEAVCWGDNGWGQRGDGTRTTSPVPGIVPQQGIVRAMAIAAGGRHTCRFLRDEFGNEAIECWGLNTRGQLGSDGAYSAFLATSPTLAFPLSFTNGVVNGLTAGRDHTCLSAGSYEGFGGGVQCWGDDFDSQLGRGTSGGFSASLVSVQRAFAVPLTLNARVVRAAAGGTHTCAVTDDSRVACWGGTGVRGENSAGGSLAPRAVEVFLP